ncbi:MAG: leucine-rich repeat domain-containing protein [Faecalicoccus sp.]|nr:leucine-rich repeat domain-containing protein [Faecalicoccus sp.]
MRPKRVLATSTILVAAAFLGLNSCQKNEEDKPEKEVVTYQVNDTQKEPEEKPQKEVQKQPEVQTAASEPEVTYTYVAAPLNQDMIPAETVPEPVYTEPQIPDDAKRLLDLMAKLNEAKLALEDAKTPVENIVLNEIQVEEVDEDGNIILDDEGNAKSHTEYVEERTVTTKGDVEAAQALVDSLQAQVDALSTPITPDPEQAQTEIPQVIEEENYKYTVKDDHVVIDQYVGTDTDVVIPEILDEKPVTDINAIAFYDKEVESVVMPDTVQTIRNSSFANDSSLKDIQLSDALTTIGQNAFANCTSLETIVIPETVTMVSMGAFNGCLSLTEIEIPDGVAYVDSMTFANCASLENVKVSSQTSTIGMNAFKGCISLTKLSLPSTVTLIDWNAFAGCSNLTDIYFQGTKAEWDAIIVRPGALDASVTVHFMNEPVASEADFEFIESSNDIVITKYIGSDTNVSIPETIRDKNISAIGEGAFAHNETIEQVNILSKALGIGVSAFEGCSNLQSVSLPDSVQSIGAYAFKDCVSLKDFIIPADTSVIEEGAFRNCASLVNIVIPEGVTEIQKDAFKGCSSLNALTLPNSLKKLGSNALNVGKQLEYIYYNGTTDEFLQIKRGKAALRNVHVVCQNQWNDASDFEYTVSGDSVVINKYIGSNDTVYVPYKIEDKMVTSIGNNAFTSTAVKIVVLPNSVTSLGSFVFGRCQSLTTVVLPNTITDMAMSTFSQCKSLKTVELPLSITDVPNMAFENCTSLTNVTIPEGVKTIGMGAFSSTTSLRNLKLPSTLEKFGFTVFMMSGIRTLTIPVSVTRLDNMAFLMARNLDAIYYEGTKAQWDAISKGMNAVPSDIIIHTIDE